MRSWENTWIATDGTLLAAPERLNAGATGQQVQAWLAARPGTAAWLFRCDSLPTESTDAMLPARSTGTPTGGS